MTTFEAALQDQTKAEYIKKHHLLQFDEKLLWLVDLLAQAKESLSGEQFKITETFYTNLLTKLLRASKLHQYNSLQFVFCQSPPETVKKVLKMCAFMNVDYQSVNLWRALVALCLPLPPNWTYSPESRGFNCSNQSDYLQLKREVVNLPPLPLAFHPCDAALAAIEIDRVHGHVIVPFLEPAECTKVPKNFILAYDFKEMQPVLVPMVDKNVPQMLNIPHFRLSFSCAAEIYSAAVQANEAVFRAKSGLRREDLLINLEEEFKTLLDTQNAAKKKFDREAIQNDQRTVPAHTALTRMQRRLIKQPTVDFDFLTNKIEFTGEMKLFGHSLVDAKTYVAYHQQATQKSPLDTSCSQEQEIGEKVQVRAILTAMYGACAGQYLEQIKGVLKQSVLKVVRDKTKFLIATVDGQDYPLPQFDVFDIKLGWLLQMGGYQIALGQMNYQAKSYFSNVHQKIQEWIEKLSHYDPAAKQVVSGWDNGKYSIRFMITKLIEYVNELKAKVEFLDIDWVFGS